MELIDCDRDRSVISDHGLHVFHVFLYYFHVQHQQPADTQPIHQIIHFLLGNNSVLPAYRKTYIRQSSLNERVCQFDLIFDKIPQRTVLWQQLYQFQKRRSAICVLRLLDRDSSVAVVNHTFEVCCRKRKFEGWSSG